MDIDTQLPGWVRDKFKLPLTERSISGYKYDQANWAVISRSFDGFFATPAPGTIRFLPDYIARQGLVNRYVTSIQGVGETGVPSLKLTEDHPLYPFFEQVIASEQSSEDFLMGLRQPGRFDLEAAILYWQDRLPGAEAWADEAYFQALEDLRAESRRKPIRDPFERA